MNQTEATQPYETGRAVVRSQSSYMGCIDGELVRLLEAKTPSAHARYVHNAFRSLIANESYPCIGARASLNTESYRLGTYEEMGSVGSTLGLARDLCAFAAERPLMKTDYATFVAIFDEPNFNSERDFEATLWKQLETLHQLDSKPYDLAASSDPDSPRFAFSFAGTAYFVVGMHPGASRIARRFSFPALVFNPHAQFDTLRSKGLYQRFVNIVRSRDLALQGSTNPSLGEFGDQSEARQYAGRAVDENWKCPFRS